MRAGKDVFGTLAPSCCWCCPPSSGGGSNTNDGGDTPLSTSPLSFSPTISTWYPPFLTLSGAINFMIHYNSRQTSSYKNHDDHLTMWKDRVLAVSLGRLNVCSLICKPLTPHQTPATKYHNTSCHLSQLKLFVDDIKAKWPQNIFLVTNLDILLLFNHELFARYIVLDRWHNWLILPDFISPLASGEQYSQPKCNGEEKESKWEQGWFVHRQLLAQIQHLLWRVRFWVLKSRNKILKNKLASLEDRLVQNSAQRLTDGGEV